MHHNVLSGLDFSKLPSDPCMKSIAIESHCRNILMSAISDEGTEYFDKFTRSQYMEIVSEAANELGIGDLSFFTSNTEHVQDQLEDFLTSVSKLIMRIQLRSHSNKDELSVRLSSKSKGIIESKLAEIRILIAESDLPERKKQSLLDKIEKFRTELHNERLRFGPTMATLVYIAAGIAGLTSFAADAPDAIATIMQLVGEEKEAEVTELTRLEAPNEPAKITHQPIEQGFALFKKEDKEVPF